MQKCSKCGYQNLSNATNCKKCNASLHPTSFPHTTNQNLKNFSNTNESVFLEAIDGFDFESLCQRIFEKSGWGQVELTTPTGDGGRDLIIHSPLGVKTIVECKHWKTNSVGRPVVQKLHSAIITSNTKHGIIITSGKFSQQAIDYVNEIKDGTKIQLFDIQKLTELAQIGGITIVNKDEDLSVNYIPITNEVKIKTSLLQKFNKFQCYPNNISDILSVNIDSISLIATYMAEVDINQDFVTGAGLIHQIKKNSQKYYFDGSNGRPIDINNFESLPTNNFTELFDKSKIPNSIHISQFTLDRTSLYNQIYDYVIRNETIKVNYRGKNNSVYSKICEPNKKFIRINSISQILIPNYTVKLKISSKIYSTVISENKNMFNFLNNNLSQCKICNQLMSGNNILVCNACGNLCHSTEQKPRHSFFCEQCKKSICKECTFYERKFLFFKKKLCFECAKIKSSNPKKLE